MLDTKWEENLHCLLVLRLHGTTSSLRNSQSLSLSLAHLENSLNWSCGVLDSTLLYYISYVIIFIYEKKYLK